MQNRSRTTTFKICGLSADYQKKGAKNTRCGNPNNSNRSAFPGKPTPQCPIPTWTRVTMGYRLLRNQRVLPFEAVMVEAFFVRGNDRFWRISLTKMTTKLVYHVKPPTADRTREFITIYIQYTYLYKNQSGHPSYSIAVSQHKIIYIHEESILTWAHELLSEAQPVFFAHESSPSNLKRRRQIDNSGVYGPLLQGDHLDNNDRTEVTIVGKVQTIANKPRGPQKAQKYSCRQHSTIRINGIIQA